MFLHGDLPDRPEPMHPLTIRRGSFESTLYDIDSLLEMPLTNLRKLWGIMFDTAWENDLAISMIRDWLPSKIAEIEKDIKRLEYDLPRLILDADEKRRAVAAWGSELENRIMQAKRNLQISKRRKNEKQIATANEQLSQVSRPITEHDQAVKTIKQTETMIKHAKTQLEKVTKLQTIFYETAKQKILK